MRKLLIVFLGLLFLSTPQLAPIDNFVYKIKEAYIKYEIVKQEENDSYAICIVRGINKNKSCFGVYFKSDSKDEYYCCVSDDKYTYTFKTSSSDTVEELAIQFDKNVNVKIYDCDENLEDNILVKYVTESTFNGLEGNGNGASVSKLRNLNTSSGVMIFYVIGIGIIALCAIIIIILKLTKRGLFNDQKRTEDINNYVRFADDYVNEELHEVEEATEEIEPVQVYERTRDYDYEEDESRPSVKSLLEERGFNSNYQMMDVEEKNKVMVELMMMREQKVINNDEYQHEIVELWKK